MASVLQMVGGLHYGGIDARRLRDVSIFAATTRTTRS
jgi:hypothetical protein